MPKHDCACGGNPRFTADYYRQKAAALHDEASEYTRLAREVEHAHGIPAPCHLCGRREGCGH